MPNPLRLADYSDQTGWFNPTRFNEAVTLIGCGSIGSSVAATLCQMGVQSFRFYDSDAVEARNVAVSAPYRLEDISRLKVEVLQEWLLANGAREVEAIPRHFTTADADDLTSVVISGVDSMEARRMIWEAISTMSLPPHIYWDGRIGGLQYTLFTVNPNDAEWYEQGWLEGEGAELECAMRNICFVPQGLAAELAGLFVRFCNGEVLPRRTERHFGGNHFQIIQRPKED